MRYGDKVKIDSDLLHCEGTFLQFSMEGYTDRDEFSLYPAAIVELDDGEISSFLLHEIRRIII